MKLPKDTDSVLIFSSHIVTGLRNIRFKWHSAIQEKFLEFDVHGVFAKFLVSPYKRFSIETEIYEGKQEIELVLLFGDLLFFLLYEINYRVSGLPVVFPGPEKFNFYIGNKNNAYINFSSTDEQEFQVEIRYEEQLHVYTNIACASRQGRLITAIRKNAQILLKRPPVLKQYFAEFEMQELDRIIANHFHPYVVPEN